MCTLPVMLMIEIHSRTRTQDSLAGHAVRMRNLAPLLAVPLCICAPTHAAVAPQQMPTNTLICADSIMLPLLPFLGITGIVCRLPLHMSMDIAHLQRLAFAAQKGAS